MLFPTRLSRSNLLTTILSFWLAITTIQGQSIGFQGQTRYTNLMDRLEIKYGLDASSSVRYYSTKHMWHQLDTMEITGSKDQWEAQHFMNQYNLYASNQSNTTESTTRKYVDSTETFYTMEEQEAVIPTSEFRLKVKKPVLKYFYDNPHHFLSVDRKGLKIRANPILDVRYGNGKDDPNTIFKNTRAAELMALIDDRIYIYTRVLENQERFNNYVDKEIPQQKYIPGNGFYKDYTTSIKGINGYDYLNTQAYIGMPLTKHVAIELGHGRHFIGNGYRSLLLSDFANNYFYLKLDTKIWRFHYQNVFAELGAYSTQFDSNDLLVTKKYMANHFLTFDVTKNFQIGVFETVVFAREDQFELQYLNPIILYRTVEQSLGSPDNVLIGFNLRYNLLNSVQLYGQTILDEFNRGQLGTGWWANKFGFQGGLKYIDAFGVSGLDIRGEYNQVRPFTYAQSRPLENFPELTSSSYHHGLQPLAHPLGANFREYLLGVNWIITNKLRFESLASFMSVGEEDGSDVFIGQDITRNTNDQGMIFNHEIGQGVAASIVNARARVSYEIRTNYYVDLNTVIRMKDSDDDSRDQSTLYIGAGFRANIGMTNFDF